MLKINEYLHKPNLEKEVYVMAATNLNIRTDKEIKEEAEQIFSELGLNMTTAVNMLLRTVVRERGIPFSLKLEVPNSLTAAAVEEGRRLAYNDKAPAYTSIEELKTALNE